MNVIKYLFLFFLLNNIWIAGEARDAFDDLIAFVDDPEITNLITNSAINVTRQAPSKNAVLVILKDLEIIQLLQENFYLRTNNLKSRSLLDYPEFTPFRQNDCQTIFIDLFYNQTSRLNFTKDNSNICSYLGIFQPSFVQKLEKTIDRAKQDLNLNLEIDEGLRLLNLLQTFTVQERRLGLMIGGATSFCGWNLQVMAPWYYLERNHFVDDKIKESIEQLVIDIQEEIGGVTQLTPQQTKAAQRAQDRFINQHFISDKFGIGDTRIYLDYPLIKKPNLSSRLGVLATVPTAFAMAKGLRGTHLHRAINRPSLDLIEIVGQATQQQPTPQVLDFGIAALDNLSAILLDTPLGNGGHFGLGVFLRNKSPLNAIIKQEWARNFTMRSFLSLEYQFPAVELRSFALPANEALFNAHNFDSEDLIDINNNYDFINQQITDRLFPLVLQTRVNPGIIFRWSSQFCYERENHGFTLGTDTYVRNKEKFSDIDANPSTKKMIDSFNARSPLAYQSKAVGSVFFKIDKPDRLYTVALIGDYTFMNKGIGADFTLGLNFDVTF